MKVFISWSGERSQAVAQTLRSWLKHVIQALDPKISMEDIHKGQQWGLILAEELESAHAGVICLTPENLKSPWLLFEAGALSKLHKAARVCTYLIDMPYADVPPGPFSQFQHTLATKDDTYRMVRSIHGTIPEGQRQLTEPELNQAFERCWPELEQCLATLPEPQGPIPPQRTTDDMLREVLEIVRDLADPSPIRGPGARLLGPGGAFRGSIEEALALAQRRYGENAREALLKAAASVIALQFDTTALKPKTPNTSKRVTSQKRRASRRRE
jgi:TIR domain